MMVRNESECSACPEGRGDLLGDSEQSSFTTQNSTGQKRGHRARRVLVWLGHRLVAWGRRLEERNCAVRLPLSSCL
jgi:hypothetical protein